ncbi:plastocyanin/azurin family copper-binding protein [Haloarcula sp. H-GB4]|uniref:cupredoxin domain-containing protein n=1 Tax=Haloarcula sp. H-GB4 TaxID=3069755 RepID=UPI0027B051BD|nr:plastocyanin/azurin family copper-binding protein [Haloarcula sp. H-GB4]MDQ2074527.1 plastocyanin/azurin family copper-binding protein [Haloarcula sp. H-GB4]
MAKWTRRSLLQGIAMAGLTSVAGCSTSIPGVPPPKPRIDVQSNGFNPGRLVINPGETVTWWDIESLKHTVTAYEKRIPGEADYFASGGFDSEIAARSEQTDPGLLSPGDRFAHQFTVPGHYHYCCLPHEDFETMAGKVVVRTSAGEIPPPPKVVEPDTDHVIQMGLMRYYPESLTVQPGDSVGWVNGTGIAHSVTGEDGGQAIPEGDDRVFPENGEYFASGGFASAEAAVEDWGTARKGDILPEGPFIHTFEEPGTYPYLCLLHSLNMVGTVTVREM